MPLHYANIPTMISKEERNYLYNLSGKDWNGKGIIVEIGPWLGGSTYCLASGLRDSSYEGSKKLLVFDNFIWREFMNSRSGLNLHEGDSFYDEFRKNTKELSYYIDSYEASLPDEKVDNDTYADQRRQKSSESKLMIKNFKSDPVEILFIDGAKSWTAMKYLITEFYPYFIPHSTILVCQDYKYWGMYWVVMIIEKLSHKLEVRDILESNTVSFKLIEKLDNTDIDRIPDFDSITISEGLLLLGNASKRLKENGDLLGSKIVELNAIRFLVHKGGMEQAINQMISLERKWPLLLNDRQLLQTKKWLTEQTRNTIPYSLRTNVRRFVEKVKRLLRRFGI